MKKVLHKLLYTYLPVLCAGLSYWTNAWAQSWQNVGAADFSTGANPPICFAIDHNNVPYIAYKDDLHWYKATVMKYTGSIGK